MKMLPFRRFLLAGSFAALAFSARAQVVTLRATVNAAQEVPATSSPATGSVIMLYDVNANSYDLVVTLNNFANTVTNSHIHEAPAGTAGSVVSPLGAEAVYQRSGNTLTAIFRGLTYGGDKLKLLQGGAYYNVHSSTFPGGEIRGQLIADPKRLYANITVAQEQAASTATITSSANGAAVMYYDPVANKISLRLSLFNFTNTFTNSHFHEAAAGAAGSVVTALGGGTVAGYANGGGGFYNGTFDIPYTGDPIKLLTSGAYLNFHSNVYAGGEVRGQVVPSEEIPSSRVINLSARGQVGSGNQVLIEGFSVIGPEPVRVLITAKGPSLSAYGVTGVLSDPVLSLFDSTGRQIATNNDIGTVAAGSDLASISGVPTNSVESALIVVLPPGTYSAMVSGNNGATGIALVEINDLRTLNPRITTADALDVASVRTTAKRATAHGLLELCGGTPLKIAAVGR
jgi:hypothetical protein